MRAAIAGALIQAMYQDAKNWIVGLGKHLPILEGGAKLKRFEGPQEFWQAANAGSLSRGDSIAIRCRPSRFGPYLNSHFVSPIVGPNLGMRLGPPLIGPNPMFAIMANATSHLLPVGLSPQVDSGVQQMTLYPPNTTATGFLSILPMARDLVPTVPALVSADILPHAHWEVWLHGRAEFLESTTLVAMGLLEEDYEVIRQAGRIWFVDATNEDAKAELIAEPLELWGGLYAAGHLEFEGELPVQDVVEVFASQAQAAGHEARVVQNQAGAREVSIFSTGLRIQVATDSPFYAFHADTDFVHGFGRSRSAFDSLVSGTLEALKQLCLAKGTELHNPLDLDFTYTDSAKAYSVMRSGSAEAIRDPVALALRDWHRQRSQRSKGDSS